MTIFEMEVPAGDVEPPRFDVQGHRGARGLLPENTLPGFVRALELGVTTLEMDVVISRDGEVVLSHDPWFSSDFSSLPSGARIRRHEQYAHRIFEMDYETICTYDCGLGNRRFPRQMASRSRKPRLKDVLRTAEDFTRAHGREPVFYNIETKTSPAGDEILHPRPATVVDRLLDVISDARVLERSIIQSFDPRTLRIVRLRDVPARTSLLISRSDFLGIAADLTILGFQPDVYSPDFRLVNSRMVEEVHARGMRLIPWTVNNAADMRRMVDAGTDGFITDYPDTARAVL